MEDEKYKEMQCKNNELTEINKEMQKQIEYLQSEAKSINYEESYKTLRKKLNEIINLLKEIIVENGLTNESRKTILKILYY